MIRFGIKIVYLQRYMTSFTDICMEKTLILQNPHWEGKTYAGLYRRQLMDNLLQKKTLPHVQILTGVRRCGKSTLFKLLINDLIEDGVSPKSILNINLDAPMFIPFWHDVSQIRLIIERAEALTGEKVEYLFLDEVQQMENWEVFVKSAYDSKEFRKIYVTGSNSNMLQSRFAAMLSGRYFENEVRPFSLRECLGTIGVCSLLDAYQRMPEVLRLINGCMAFGSFPEIVLSGLDDVLKQELLHSYFESIVQKDCIVYNSIRDSQLFYKTVNYLLRNAGNRFSPQQLAKAMNSNENTISRSPKRKANARNTNVIAWIMESCMPTHSVTALIRATFLRIWYSMNCGIKATPPFLSTIRRGSATSSLYGMERCMLFRRVTN